MISCHFAEMPGSFRRESTGTLNSMKMGFALIRSQKDLVKIAK